jgi:hypothetical protein
MAQLTRRGVLQALGALLSPVRRYSFAVPPPAALLTPVRGVDGQIVGKIIRLNVTERVHQPFPDSLIRTSSIWRVLWRGCNFDLSARRPDHG